jgi:hypothetical protein
MVTVTTDGTNAVFEIKGADKLWSLTSRLEIPLAHIKEARRAPDHMPGWTGWLTLDGAKIAGAHIPGVIAAGTFYHKDGWVFWDVHHTAQAIEVVLHDETFSRLVVEVEDPDRTIALLNATKR